MKGKGSLLTQKKVVSRTNPSKKAKEEKKEVVLVHSCANPECKDPIGKGIKKCSRCKIFRYCSVECQKQHWPTHKPFCSAMIEFKIDFFLPNQPPQPVFGTGPNKKRLEVSSLLEMIYYSYRMNMQCVAQAECKDQSYNPETGHLEILLRDVERNVPDNKDVLADFSENTIPYLAVRRMFKGSCTIFSVLLAFICRKIINGICINDDAILNLSTDMDCIVGKFFFYDQKEKKMKKPIPQLEILYTDGVPSGHMGGLNAHEVVRFFGQSDTVYICDTTAQQFDPTLIKRTSDCIVGIPPSSSIKDKQPQHPWFQQTMPGSRDLEDTLFSDAPLNQKLLFRCEKLYSWMKLAYPSLVSRK